MDDCQRRGDHRKGAEIMSRRIMLIPISTGVGLTSVSVGLVRALEQKAVKVNFF
jgi:hypothetical protein